MKRPQNSPAEALPRPGAVISMFTPSLYGPEVRARPSARVATRLRAVRRS